MIFFCVIISYGMKYLIGGKRMLAFYLLLTGCCPLKLQTSLINSIFIGCGRPNRWVGERDNSPKGMLQSKSIGYNTYIYPLSFLFMLYQAGGKSAQLGITLESSYAKEFREKQRESVQKKKMTLTLLWVRGSFQNVFLNS